MEKKLCSFLLWTGGLIFVFGHSLPYQLLPISIVFCILGVIMLYSIKDKELAEKKRLEKEAEILEERRKNVIYLTPLRAHPRDEGMQDRSLQAKDRCAHR